MLSVHSWYRIRTVCKSFYKTRLIPASQKCWGECAICELLKAFARGLQNGSLCILFSSTVISEHFGPTTPCLASPPYNWTFTLKFYKRRVTENKILSSVDPQTPLDMGRRFRSSCQTAGVLGHYSTKRLDLAVRVRSQSYIFWQCHFSVSVLSVFDTVGTEQMFALCRISSPKSCFLAAGMLKKFTRLLTISK